jgi:hypothetical protein
LLLLLTVAAPTLAPPCAVSAEPLRIQHVPPSSARLWRPLGVEVLLAGEVEPEEIALADAVVVATDGSLRPVPLGLSRSSLSGEVPASLVRPPAVSYFIRIVDREGVVTALPLGAPEAGLFRVPVIGDPDPVLGDVEPVEILTPGPEEVVPTARPEIAGLFDPPLEAPWFALLLLDGQDMSEAATLSPDLFVFTPDDSLAIGAHSVTVTALTASRSVEATRSFYVRERTAAVDETAAWPGDPEWTMAAGTSSAFTMFGRVEVGWATVVAETTAIESLDVFLPYEEVSRPTIDFYASGFDASRSFLITAQYNPVYDERLHWFLSGRTPRFEAEAGDIFPSLSRTTLDWAAGLGGRLGARAGRSVTEVVGMRMSEADTLGGFGLYSRFALGASETFYWGDAVGASLVYLTVFDREESVAEENRLGDPLSNHVVAGRLRGRRGLFACEAEYARSTAEGEVDGEGDALRVRVGCEGDFENRIGLEYVRTDPSYYSAGSYELEPGEERVELDFGYRPAELFRFSGWAHVDRTLRTDDLRDEGALEFRLYARSDALWTLDDGSVRAYVVGRYDRTPYVTYDYVYSYGSAGATFRRGRVRAGAGATWSRSRSPEQTDGWSATTDLRYEIVPSRWTTRAGLRVSASLLEDGGTDSSQTRVTFENRWTLGDLDIEAEYWFIERDDRQDAGQSYREHVITLSLGHAF